MRRMLFGKSKEGQDVFSYELKNSNGIRVIITEQGASVVSIFIPGENGKETDIVLGYDNLYDYEENPYFLGTIVGRNANRIAFDKYSLYKNEGTDNLHSGPNYYHKRVWKSEACDNTVNFFLTSPKGDQDYFSKLDIKASYTLTDDNELIFRVSAISDEDTICNFTNHSYFNLNGIGSGDILGHELVLNAKRFTGYDKNLIPRGDVYDVDKTPFDFREKKEIGKEIGDNNKFLVYGEGYDINYMVDGVGIREFAWIRGEKSNICMRLYSNTPGFQLYSGNFLGSAGFTRGKDDAIITRRSGLCIEPQYCPNALNIPGFDSPVLFANKEYELIIKYAFDGEFL